PAQRLLERSLFQRRRRVVTKHTGRKVAHHFAAGVEHRDLHVGGLGSGEGHGGLSILARDDRVDGEGRLGGQHGRRDQVDEQRGTDSHHGIPRTRPWNHALRSLSNNEYATVPCHTWPPSNRSTCRRSSTPSALYARRMRSSISSAHFEV